MLKTSLLTTYVFLCLRGVYKLLKMLLVICIIYEKQEVIGYWFWWEITVIEHPQLKQFSLVWKVFCHTS